MLGKCKANSTQDKRLFLRLLIANVSFRVSPQHRLSLSLSLSLFLSPGLSLSLFLSPGLPLSPCTQGPGDGGRPSSLDSVSLWRDRQLSSGPGTWCLAWQTASFPENTCHRSTDTKLNVGQQNLNRIWCTDKGVPCKTNGRPQHNKPLCYVILHVCGAGILSSIQGCSYLQNVLSGAVRLHSKVHASFIRRQFISEGGKRYPSLAKYDLGTRLKTITRLYVRQSGFPLESLDS